MKTMVFVGNSGAGGLSVHELNRETGDLTEADRYMAEDGLAPLAVSPDRRFVYAAVRTEPMRVAAFAVDGVSGGLHFLNAVPVPAAPTYMSVDGGGRFLLVASYGGDLVYTLALGREGMVQAEPVEILRPGRNPHAIVLDPANRFAYVPLLGSDRIAQYLFDAATGVLTALDPPFVTTPREAGPRHMVLQVDGRHAYVLTELGGEIVKYAVNRERGTLTLAHGVTILPPERALPPGTYQPPRNAAGGPNSPSPVMWTADLHLTPDGRFLYASERTNSTISHFSVDAVSGRLDFLGVTETEGRPRSFAMDPFGEFLTVVGETSNHLAVFRIDRESGFLSQCSRVETGTAPTWVETVVYH